MRWGFGCLAVTLAVSACSEDKAERLAADWGCDRVEGLEAISGDKAPAWILVGEFTETTEAPAAFADVACNLATDGRKLFVGVSDYIGGATDAETCMLIELNAMIAKGAPIFVGHTGSDDHPYITRDRSETEKAWARRLAQKVSAAGASRALLLVSRTDAIAYPIPPSGDRFAGYSPMPVFLRGGVVSLEVAPQPAAAAHGPAIRIYPAMRDGFDGQLALASLTRPRLALVMPPDRPASESGDAAEPEDTETPSVFNLEDHKLLRSEDAPVSPVTPAEYQEIFDQLIEGLLKWQPE